MCTQVNEASSPGTTKGTNTDDIDVIDRVELDMGRLCMNDLYSDVEFLVEEHRLPAHRNILAVRSEYFSAMLYEKNLQQNASLSNICKILNAAHRYSMNGLRKKCLNFMDCKASDVLQHASFAMLCKESLEEVLERDTFYAPEVEIFQAVCKWRALFPSEDIKTVISHIRLPLMSVKELLRVVRPTGIFDLDQIMDAMDQIKTTENLPHRSVVLRGENVCKVIRCCQYDYTVFEISKVSLINCISLTVSVGGKWTVRFTHNMEHMYSVGTYDMKPNVRRDIYFEKAFARYIYVTAFNQNEIDSEVIVKYK
ncbi:BTB/POZ domain-containing protein 9-like [Drosophila pseudoobscura]|uniref:BTB/POZ domain-containing protein 9-like n=1 Tax=Drosophila pseudoobscura pseudoobscura TaxID=46245 RepID=A0A6I8W229_DROPS|nr:BTB/POZ domain-containing protein 9 [Drosophila pseudoobscura]